MPQEIVQQSYDQLRSQKKKDIRTLGILTNFVTTEGTDLFVNKSIAVGEGIEIEKEREAVCKLYVAERIPLICKRIEDADLKLSSSHENQRNDNFEVVDSQKISEIIKNRLDTAELSQREKEILENLNGSYDNDSSCPSFKLRVGVFGIRNKYPKLHPYIRALNAQISPRGVRVAVNGRGPNSAYFLKAEGFEIAPKIVNPYEEKWKILKNVARKENFSPQDPFHGRSLIKLQKNIHEKIEGLSFGEKQHQLLAILFNSLSEQTSLNTHEEAFFLYPELSPDKALDYAEWIRNGLKKKLANVGIVLRRVGKGYSSRFYIEDPEFSTEYVKEIEYDLKSERIQNKLLAIDLSPTLLTMVEGLIGFHAPDKSRIGGDWWGDAFPEMSYSQGQGNIHANLPRLRSKLSTGGLKVAMQRDGKDYSYYLDESEGESEIRVPLKRGVPKNINTQFDSEEEKLRKEVMERIRKATYGDQKGLLD